MNDTGTNTPFSILVAEDNEGDILLMETMLEDTEEDHTLTFTMNGEETLEHLKNNTPDIIILDINMPKLNGLETLEKIKQDDRLKDIPIFMLTSSKNHSDIETALTHGANGFVVKGNHFTVLDLMSFCEAIKYDEKAWVFINE